MKNLLVNLKLLTFIFFLLFLLPSCNNEEIFVIEQSALIAEEPETEEEVNTEDSAPSIDVVDDTIFTMQNTPVDIEVHINDLNLPESITISNTNPSNGVLAINTNETPDNLIDDIVVYTPNAGFSGIDSFEYTICEATDTENCDTANVTITVEPREDDIATELKAFPSAEGAGGNTTGGRGGIVVHVTHLDWNDTPGSLKLAINGNGSTFTKTTPRTVVFDISGTIVFNTIFWGSGIKNLTIAGQTAPQGGITIQNPGFKMSRSENVIIRYIRFVNTNAFYNNDSNSQALDVQGSNNAIVDHCSFRYSKSQPGFTAQDGNDLVDGQDNVTLQRSIIGDCFTGAIMGAIASEPRASSAGKNSAHHNLFAHIDHRFPNIAGNGQGEIVENVAYNYRSRMNQFFNDSETNFVNNTFKAGPASIFGAGRLNNIAVYLGLSSYTPRVYISGNRIDSNGGGYDYTPTNTDMAGIVKIWSGVSPDIYPNPTALQENTFRSNEPFADLGVPITKLGTDIAYTDILNNVGANAYLNADGTVGKYLDIMDSHYINDTKNGTMWNGGSTYVNKTDQSALVYPTLPTNIRPAGYDTDGDGMPNIWEIANGFDPNINDSMEDRDGDLYTNLEEFLNSVDK